MNKSLTLGMLVLFLVVSCGHVYSAISCVPVNISYFNVTLNDVDDGYTVYNITEVFPTPVNFTVKVWTEDLNYRIKFFDDSGNLLEKYEYCCDHNDDDNYIDYFKRSYVANQVSVRVTEGGDESSHKFGYSISYMDQECVENCNCTGEGCIENSVHRCVDNCSLVQDDSCGANITDAYWGNLKDGSRIENLSVGGSALMVVGGDELDDKDINFTIQKKGSGTVWNLWNLFGLIKSWADLQVIQGNGAEVSPPMNETGTFRFNAAVEGTTVEQVSNELGVSSSSLNARPSTEIISPVVDGGYCVGSDINFSQQSYDSDDLLNLTWNFGNGTTYSIENYSQVLSSSKSGNVSGRYFSAVDYNVRLTAKEMTRAQSDSDAVSIRVLGEGVNIFPIISSPIKDSVQGYLVWYNASQSYILNCSRNLPGALSNLQFCNGALNCSYILGPGQDTPVSGKVLIRWREIDANGNTVKWIRGNDTEGVAWNSTNYGDDVNLNGAVIFPVNYDSIQFRRVRMEMSYIE